MVIKGESKMNYNYPQTEKKLYETDFYLWLEKTADLLKAHKFEQIDLDNLIEEIEAMGRNEKRELKSRLTTIIEHLLKLKYWISEKKYNQRGWCNTIIEQRREIKFLLKGSPSLKKLLPDIFLDCYQAAREDTLKKSRLSSDIFPIKPDFTIEEILDSDYFPE